MVVVQMVTYNHEKYVEQAIESVMMQKTSFRYKLIIAEDYSTDRTREICIELQNKYPDKIDLLLNSRNLGVTLNALQVHKACIASGAKYVAICEGDDYWTDQYKLQKQVSFLETQPSYAIVFGYTETLEQGVLSNHHMNLIRKELSIKNFLQGNAAGHETCTAVLRLSSSMAPLITLLEESPIQFGDWMCYLWLLRDGKQKAIILPEVLGVYRKHMHSSYSSLDRQQVVAQHISFIQYILSTDLLLQQNRETMIDYLRSLTDTQKKEKAKIGLARLSLILYRRLNKLKEIFHTDK